MPAAVTVVNLSTREQKVYTCTPMQAVISAYAQERNDWNTWDYQKKYSRFVECGKYTYLCGDWCVLHTIPEEMKQKALQLQGANK